MSTAEMKIMTITPEIAAEMLEHNVKNRPLSPSRIAMHAAAMKAGEWALNGEAIKFDVTGRLMDGQHRLKAVIQSNVAIQTAVIRGLPPQSINTLDTGKNRSAADVLALSGNVSPAASRAFAAATRLLMLYEVQEPWGYSTAGSKIRFSSNVMIERYVKIHLQELTDRFNWLTENLPRYGALMQVGDLMFLYIVMCRKSPEEANQFFLRVFKGVGLEDGSQEFALRTLLLKRRQKISDLPLGATRYTIVRVWNALRTSHKLPRLAWRQGDDVPFAL
ncbi:hypothetical protein MWH03_00570 [Klebsiella pneumoniae]|nr:hypothetical protein [Klebsiella pneumoniae]